MAEATEGRGKGGGGGPSITAGSLEFLQEIVTVAEVQDVVFNGLDGETDLAYLITAEILGGSGAVEGDRITLRPNGISAGQDQSGIVFANSVQAGSAGTDLLVCYSPDAAAEGGFFAFLNAKKGRYRHVKSINQSPESPYPVVGNVSCSTWEDATTAIASLTIHHPHALGIGAGSVFKLYRLTKQTAIVSPNPDPVYTFQSPGVLDITHNDDIGRPAGRGNTVSFVKANVVARPVGADITVDILLGDRATGTLAFPFHTFTIADGTLATDETFTPVVVPTDHFITLSINQVGSTTPGTSLTVEVG